MKKYYSPQITLVLDDPSDFIALSIIDGGSADENTPAQTREDGSVIPGWYDAFAYELDE